MKKQRSNPLELSEPPQLIQALDFSPGWLLNPIVKVFQGWPTHYQKRHGEPQKPLDEEGSHSGSFL
jgi:hypothetical protein